MVEINLYCQLFSHTKYLQMKKVYKSLFVLIGLISFLQTNAQFSFTNKTIELLEESDFFSGVALGIADINNDGLDDIIRLDSARILQIEFQKSDGSTFNSYEHGQITNDGEWAIVIGDVNNDGYNDIMTGGAYDQLKLLTFNSVTSDLNESVMPNSSIFLQGANFTDINNDGFLDAFGCHDDAESHIWLNDGAGNMLSANQTIDMATKPSSDNSGNYGSVWTDFDNDRDLDLYIAKCRLGVSDPEDPRRINALFENDGSNNYSNTSEARNLKIGYQSWTAEFQDIDNDGDFDCFITNHDHQCQILENDGRGNFTDITNQTNLNLNGFIIQGIMRDVDNDGFIDIITTNPGSFYRNNGDKTFTEYANQISITNPNSLTCGDLNHDGFIDFYVSYANNINQFSGKSDALFINDGNDNNFFAIDLEGIESNKKGVGARIEIHGDWGIQVREVRAGESYGISASLTQYFGLGTASSIDYVVVKWPSGNTDVIQNPDINQFLTIKENTSCQLNPVDLMVNGNGVLCPGESVEILAPVGFTYLWQNGANSQSIVTSNAGNFSVVLIDANGCITTSNIVSIEYAPDETPSISINGDLAFCDGEEVILTSSPAIEYEWSTGETAQSISVTTSGDYSVIIDGSCGEWESESVTVEVFDNPSIPVVENDTLFEPGQVILTASGSNPQWFEDQISTNALGSGNNFETPFIDVSTTYYVEDQLGYGGGDYAVGMIEHQGSDFNSQGFNGEMNFNVETDIILKSVTIYTDTYGEREILLINQFGTTIESFPLNVQSDTTVVDLNFSIPTGNDYILTTNGTVNQQSIGMNSPRLKRSNEGVDYPYAVDDILSINGSDGGPGFYYYFFDWQIEASPTLICNSDRIPVEAVVIISSTFNTENLTEFSIYPNPSQGMLNVDLKSVVTGAYDMKITDLNGKLLLNKSIQLPNNQNIITQVDLSTFPKGMYFLNIEKEGKIGWAKLLIE